MSAGLMGEARARRRMESFGREGEMEWLWRLRKELASFFPHTDGTTKLN